MTPNVRVLPSALWTTPCMRPRTTILPSRLMNFERHERAGDRAPALVSPAIRELRLPWAVCATSSVTAPRARRGADCWRAPRSERDGCGHHQGDEQGQRPRAYLFLKLCMWVPSPGSLPAAEPERRRGPAFRHARSAHPSWVHRSGGGRHPSVPGRVETSHLKEWPASRRCPEDPVTDPTPRVRRRARRGRPAGRAPRPLPGGGDPAGLLRRQLARPSAAATADRLDRFVREEWGGRLIRGWDEGWFELPETIGDDLARVLLGAAPGQTASATRRRCCSTS